MSVNLYTTENIGSIARPTLHHPKAPPHELAEYNELQDKLNTALGQLSDKTKEIFVLHKLKGVPVLQISRELNLSEKAVGYHLTKSVKKLKTQLRDYI